MGIETLLTKIRDAGGDKITRDSMENMRHAAERWRRDMESVGLLPPDFPDISIEQNAQDRGRIDVRFMRNRIIGGRPAWQALTGDEAQAMLDEYARPVVTAG